MACIGRFYTDEAFVECGRDRVALIRQESSLEVNYSQLGHFCSPIGANPDALTLKRNSYPTKPHRRTLALLALPIAAPLFLLGWALTIVGKRRERHVH